MAAGKTIDIIKVGEVGTTTVGLNSFLAALETCSGVNDTIQIDGVDYILSSAEFGGNPSGAATWGAIAGDILDQADLQAALALKADLVGGKVPASQLPSYVDDVLEFANQAAFPATGETGKIYVDMAINHCFRWSGSAYVDVTQNDMGNGTNNYLPQILFTSSGKIITYKNSAISDDADIFSASLGAAGQFAGVRSSGVLGMFSQTNESHVSVGGPTSPGGGYTRIHSLIQNLVTGKPFTFSGITEIVANEIAVFNASGQLISQPIVLPITYSDAAALASASSIVSGQHYLITDPSTINLGVVVVGSPNPKKFQTEALGGFLNVDYQFVGDYDLTESITGFAAGVMQGVWRYANQASYANGDIVFQGGRIFQVIDSSAFNSSNPTSNPTAYYCFYKENFLTERVGYIQEWCTIEYDFSNDIPKWIFDSRNNIINFASMNTFQFGNDMVEWQQGDSECIIFCNDNIGEIVGFQNLGSNVNADTNEGTINECSFSKGGFEINLASGTYHSFCSCSNPESFSFKPDTNHFGKNLSENSSSFEENLVITGLTVVDLDGIRYAGIVNLLSTNYTEDIEHISCYLNTKVKFFNKAVDSFIACDITFYNQTDNIFINTRDPLTVSDNFLLKGTLSQQSFAEFELSNTLSSAYLINGCNYLG